MLNDFFEKFYHMTRSETDDVYGGTKTTLTAGSAFMAGIYANYTHETQIAGKEGEKSGFTILHRKTEPLHVDDYVKRDRDGRIYRIVSECTAFQTPDVAQEQYFHTTAELVEDNHDRTPPDSEEAST